MKLFFRILILFVVVPATYYFLYWVPFSFVDNRWIPNIISLLCAVGAGWYVWRKIGAMQCDLISNVVLGALVLGGAGFSAGFFGPMIIASEANQGPLLGLFMTGPAGLILGAILGFIVGKTRTNDRSSNVPTLFIKMWTGLLWSCVILSVAVIAIVSTYVPWRESKYSSNIERSSDLQKREKSLKSLHARSLSDDDIIQLKPFSNLNYLDFYSGWGNGEAKLTDIGLKNISELKLPKLDWLMLGHCNKITDEGMKYVARIQTLKYLSLAACSHITDAGLANLANSSSIETVDLRGCTAISDRGLSHLAIMPKLKEVSLGGCTNVSETGIEMLRKAFPNGKIEKDDQEWAMHTK